MAKLEVLSYEKVVYDEDDSRIYIKFTTEVGGIVYTDSFRGSPAMARSIADALGCPVQKGVAAAATSEREDGPITLDQAKAKMRSAGWLIASKGNLSPDKSVKCSGQTHTDDDGDDCTDEDCECQSCEKRLMQDDCALYTVLDQGCDECPFNTQR